MTMFLVGIAARTEAGSAAEDFYRGKVIRIIVGFSAGGGFDTFARTVARYMAKYVPGNPTVIVENMTGAGSLIAANHIYKVARADGLTIGQGHGPVHHFHHWWGNDKGSGAAASNVADAQGALGRASRSC